MPVTTLPTAESARPPIHRVAEAFETRLPRLSPWQRITLRLCVAVLRRLPLPVSREERIRRHRAALAQERRATAAERLALTVLPRR